MIFLSHIQVLFYHISIRRHFSVASYRNSVTASGGEGRGDGEGEGQNEGLGMGVPHAAGSRAEP